MNTFSTYDTGLAATLRYAGYELIETKKEGPHFRFVFDDPGDITSLKLDFETGQQGVSNVTKLLAIHDEILKQIQQRTTPKKLEVEDHSGTAEYSVRSLGAAAFLRISGFQFLRAEKSGRQRASSATFIFADDGSAKNFVEQYHTHCSVDAKLFYEAVKDIRTANRKAWQEQDVAEEPAA